MRRFLDHGLALVALLAVAGAAPAVADPSSGPTAPSSSPASGSAPPAADASAGAGAAKQDAAKQDATNKPDATKPDVATLLFGTPMWGEAPVGAKLKYSFEKVTTEAAMGPSFKDEVVLTLDAGDDAKSRATEMQLFTGANRKPAGPFRSDEQNPVLLVVLENNVQELSHLFKANPRYLKNAVRKAWRENAKIEPAKVKIDGKDVDVTRITVTPFLNDPEADNMRGLSGLSYTVDVSQDIPGYIAVIDIRAPAQGKPLFAETLRYASETKP